MRLLFTTQAWDDYLYWQGTDAKTLTRLNALIADMKRHPFSGIGKPECLRGNLAGWWSRRITREHRIVYRVSGEGDAARIEVAQCRFHY